MNIEAHTPTELLRPFIKTYIIIESQSELTNNVLPDTSPVLAFRYKGRRHYMADDIKIDLPASSISGLRKTLRSFNYSKDTGNILVIFKETGASAFFKEPLHELFGESVSLNNFIGQQKLSIMEEQLSEAANNTQRIDLIEKFLLVKLYNYQPDKLISTAVEKIHSAKGLIKIKQLADLLYISQDAFEKRFRKIVGTSPKQFSSIVRMKSIIYLGQQTHMFTEIAYDTGYFDQAHFNKDFKQFTGLAPTDFFKSSSFMQITDFLQ
jgi:AraC-like DNA-binding protein